MEQEKKSTNVQNVDMNGNPANVGKKQVIPRNPDGTFPKGISGNPEGKKPGTENYNTRWKRVVERIAKQNKITPDEVEDTLMMMAFKEAKEGNYNFYKDLMDRDRKSVV